ncbi:hypothetical protein DEO72_LG8g1051 [Vigna unguiculata]|uniref:Uncharacterized protein n=1 Tax=Vigna unguiculata TaxID=3917 RepID=A0A4D6MQL1_VIGUN|nr:hypothetical protein DEO72_LG8g1051 [Vigna unguiculata]
MANEAQDTRRSSHTEQQCNICRQVVAVGDRGEVGRRRHDGGRDGGRNEGHDVRAKEGATRGSVTVARRRPQRRSDGGATVARRRPQRGLDGGATVAASFSTVARRWLPPFRLLFGGGARPTTQTSWMEAQSATERTMEREPDGGHGGGSLREREDDEQ